MWDELGIDPASDAKEIRRAYAARLRALGSNPDPERFLRLRRAYERALAAIGTSQPAASAAPQELLPPVAMSQSLPVSPHECAVLLAALQDAGRAKRYDDLFQVFEHGLATGLLALSARVQVGDQIIQTLLNDTDISAERFHAYMNRLGLDLAISRSATLSVVRTHAIARLDAANWFADLEKQARAPRARFWQRFGRQSQIAAMQIRSRAVAQAFFGAVPPIGISALTARALRQRFHEYQHHMPWIANNFDPKAIAAIEHALVREERWGTPRMRRIIAQFSFTVIWLSGSVISFALGLGLGGVAAMLTGYILYRRSRRLR